MLVHDAASGDTVAIDYREKAGGNAFRDMFLNEKGEADPEKSRYSGLAVGVPGTVAGLALALERYGTISLAQALAPAIRLAEQGIVVSEDLAASLDGAGDRLRKWPSSAKIFCKVGGAPYQPGETLVQRDLAASLRLIAEQGPERALPRADRPEDRRGGRARGRQSDHRRSAQLRGGGARAGARRLPGLRDRVDAAAELRRGAHRADPEHARGLPDRLSRAQWRQDHPPHGRGDEIRLRRPQRVSRRPRLRRRARRGAHLEGLRRSICAA